MANLNDVLQGLVNLNSKMANNINNLLDSIGEGFLDVGELKVENDVLSLQGATILVNGSKILVENLSTTFAGNKICFLEYKADKSIALKVLSVVDENFNYDLSQLDATSKHFEVARQYNGVLEDRRVASMASKDNTIVGALNGALKAIDYDNEMDLEINMDILSRVSAVESDIVDLDSKKADKTYVDEAVANVDIDGVVTAVDVVEIEDVNVSYVTREELTSYQEKSDDNLSTTDKTIIGAINELFQSANNGKELIASSIGEPLSSNQTFQAMSNDINDLLSTFKTNMMNSGVVVESGDKFKQLIDKIKGLTESEGDTEESSSGIKSYDIVEISSSDLYTSGDYYHHSLESYSIYDISLILADIKAIDDDIGFTQYYSIISYPPESSAGVYSVLVGNFNGNGETSVSEVSTYDSIPIMKTTDIFSNGTLTIFYKSGAVSNAFGQSLFNAETTQYNSVDYYTIDLNSISGKFDYIIFDMYGHTGDGDACDMTVMYNCISKRCYYMIQGYIEYSYQFDNVPSNAIPIRRADLSSPQLVNYTGFVANGSTIGGSGSSEDNTVFIESLKSVLQDADVEVSDEDDMASLIAKTDAKLDEYEAGRLDVISSTELPATGEENQICVIMDEPCDNFIITSESSPTLTEPTVVLHTSSSGNAVTLTNGNITTRLLFDSVYMDLNKYASYVYESSQWKQLTFTNLTILKNGYEVTDIVGSLRTSSALNYSEGNYIYCSGGTAGLYSIGSWSNMISFDNYSTLKYTAYTSSTTYSSNIVFAQSDTVLSTSDSNSVTNFISSSCKYSSTFSVDTTTAKEYTIDISSWTGTYYLAIQVYQTLANTYITNIELI